MVYVDTVSPPLSWCTSIHSVVDRYIQSTIRRLPPLQKCGLYVAVECIAADKKKSEGITGLVFKSAVYMVKFLCRLPRAIADLFFFYKKKRKE